MEVAKDDVLNAVLKVCRLIPGWRVPKEWLEELYSQVDGISDQDFTTQVEQLGGRVKYMYLRRHLHFYDATRLDVDMFRFGAADSFIRRLSWPKSAERDRLVDHIGDEIWN